MIRYRMKPTIVDAFQFTPLRADPKLEKTWPAWLQEAWRKNPDKEPGAFAKTLPGKDGRSKWFVTTPQGPIEVECGEYIVKGQGEIIFPVRAEVFFKTYEAIDWIDATD